MNDVTSSSSHGSESPTLGDMIAGHSQPAPPTPVAPPPAPVIPTNPTEAIARLNELKGNSEWADKFLKGNSPEVKEYKALQEMAAQAADNPVDAAMAGILEDAPLAGCR
jgi:hypothetical protein